MFKDLLIKAKNEVIEFRNSPKAKNYDESFFDSVLQVIAELKSIQDSKNFVSRYQTLTRMIVDRGPVNREFAPSLNDIGIALEKLKKRQ